MAIPFDYIERCYAGWLGKIAGVRLGAPIEGWTYDRIRRVLGDDVFDYIVDYRDFAADDDTNGPMFFLRALEDYECSEALTAEQIGKTWLNYTPFEHGFYWWGGYGTSTEHTAYLNLRAGIPAPQSGSIAQNGSTVAEQIGGQIFIDSWGLINPGEPERAARFARKAASVSHDGEGIYGGQFVAACIAAAFTCRDIRTVIETGLSVIPEDCTYRRMARDVIAFHDAHPENWRDCFDFVHDHYGYDRYPGICHIIPNSAVMVLSMLYGEGDFTRTIGICNMCGWDTDCTTGNVGAIMGVLCGLEGIEYDRWLRPIHDFLACSSVMGDLNIMDIPWSVFYMARMAYRIAGEEYPQRWANILNGDAARFHFELPGSTHSFRVDGAFHHRIDNAASPDGKGRCLKVWASPDAGSDTVEIYHKTYYRPADFNDSRYDPFFSPILYPGQRVTARVMLDADVDGKFVCCAYVLDGNSGERTCGEWTALKQGEWTSLSVDIPPMDGACIERAGVLVERIQGARDCLVAYVDDVDFSGQPNYRLNFAKERTEVWTAFHREISQLSRLKGLWTLEDGRLCGSGADFAEAYTGDSHWRDVEVTVGLTPIVGGCHQFMARVQGACRCYAVRLEDGGKLKLMKNEETRYRCLSECALEWHTGEECRLTLRAEGNVLTVLRDGEMLLSYTDEDHPYLTGSVGFGVAQGRCAFDGVRVVGRG